MGVGFDLSRKEPPSQERAGLNVPGQPFPRKTLCSMTAATWFKSRGQESGEYGARNLMSFSKEKDQAHRKENMERVPYHKPLNESESGTIGMILRISLGHLVSSFHIVYDEVISLKRR